MVVLEKLGTDEVGVILERAAVEMGVEIVGRAREDKDK